MDDPQRILIIKTGALGDVVRSTILLRAFAGRSITWITDRHCLPLFENIDLPRLTVYPVQDIPPFIFEDHFDLVLSLEEEEEAARLASRINTNRLTGVYWKDRINYSDDAAEWFDMSLISKLGQQEANRLKWNNSASYQQLLYTMIRRSFNGELYWIAPPESSSIPGRIGIESQVGLRWPNKQWQFYEVLKEELTRQGFEILWLEKKPSLHQYFNDIRSCSFLVSGDTLAMHLALAYKIPALALFTCTSPAEIYDYGILKKLVSPALQQFFYTTEFNPAAIRAIKPDHVLNAILEHWGKFYPAISLKVH